MPNGVKIQWLGTGELAENFNALPVTLQRRALRPALLKIAKRMVVTAMGLVRVRTGMLRESITYKRTREKQGRESVIVGPTRAQVKQLTSTAWWRHFMGRWPTRYAHLIERGHGGPRPAPAYPFLAPALSRHSAELGQELQAAAQRAIKRHARTLAKMGL